ASTTPPLAAPLTGAVPCANIPSPRSSRWTRPRRLAGRACAGSTGFASPPWHRRSTRCRRQPWWMWKSRRAARGRQGPRTDARPAAALVDVEVKARGEGPQGPKDVGAALAAVLAGRGDTGRVMVSSFSRRGGGAAAGGPPGVRLRLVFP